MIRSCYLSESYSLPVSRRAQLQLTRIDLLMLLVVVIWGVNFTVVKVALRSFSPLAFNALRFSLATITMIAIMRLRGRVFLAIAARRHQHSPARFCRPYSLPMALHPRAGAHHPRQYFFIDGYIPYLCRYLWAHVGH